MDYLGIDLGTSSLKIVISDNKGHIKGQTKKTYPLYIPTENWSEQDPNDWYQALIEALIELSLTFNLKEIKGLSFSGQMHGLVILDDNDQLIRKAILWNDNRTTNECDYLNNVIGKDKLIELTGNIALTGFTLPKLLWLKNNEQENFAKISKIMLPKDYLAYKITGVFASDVSDASGTLLFDVKNKRWSTKMLNILGIEEKKLPKIYNSYESIGKIKESISELTEINCDCQVIIGAGDQAAGAIGTGTIFNDSLSIQLGTSGVLFAASDNFKLDKEARLHSFCHANGKFHLMSVMLSAAGSTKWWVNDVLKQEDYASVLSNAENLIISDIIFLPYLTGERSPINDPDAVGVFYGLRANHSQADLTKALLEGICFGLKDSLNAINDLGIVPQYARVIGGGSKSKAWLQILSDILGIKLFTINTEDGGALGAVILAMIGTKEFSSIDEACETIILNKNIIHPNMNNYVIYQEKFKKFKKLYQCLKKIDEETL